jgi:hypothetical protein
MTTTMPIAGGETKSFPTVDQSIVFNADVPGDQTVAIDIEVFEQDVSSSADDLVMVNKLAGLFGSAVASAGAIVTSVITTGGLADLFSPAILPVLGIVAVGRAILLTAYMIAQLDQDDPLGELHISMPACSAGAESHSLTPSRPIPPSPTANEELEPHRPRRRLPPRQRAESAPNDGNGSIAPVAAPKTNIWGATPRYRSEVVL